MSEKLLTATELADRLGVTEETIRRWARAKRVPSIRPTKRTLRFELDAVMEAMKRQGK